MVTVAIMVMPNKMIAAWRVCQPNKSEMLPITIHSNTTSRTSGGNGTCLPARSAAMVCQFCRMSIALVR